MARLSRRYFEEVVGSTLLGRPFFLDLPRMLGAVSAETAGLFAVFRQQKLLFFGYSKQFLSLVSVDIDAAVVLSV